MRRFWKRNDLEGRLRHSRPEAPNELVDDIVSRIESSAPAPRKHASYRRLGLAGITVVAMLTMFAAFGGAGFAASGVSGAAYSTADAISTLVKAEKQTSLAASKPNKANRGNRGGRGCNLDEVGEDDVSAARGQYCPRRITICHVVKRGPDRTLTLPIRAAIRHLLRHRRDYLGPCRGDRSDSTEEESADVGEGG